MGHLKVTDQNFLLTLKAPFDAIAIVVPLDPPVRINVQLPIHETNAKADEENGAIGTQVYRHALSRDKFYFIMKWETEQEQESEENCNIIRYSNAKGRASQFLGLRPEQ